MPGPTPALCTFPEAFVQEARDTVRRRTVAVQTVQRFRLVLLLQEHPSLPNDEAAAVVDLSARQVQRWRSRWAAGDFSVDDRSGRGRQATFSPPGSSVAPGDGLRSGRGNQVAAQPPIPGRLGGTRPGDPGQKD